MGKFLSAFILVVALTFLVNCSAQINDYSDLRARYENATESNLQDSALIFAKQMNMWALKNETDTSLTYAVTSRYVGNCFYDLWQLDSAKTYYQFALKALEIQNREVSEDYTTTLNNLGYVYFDSGDHNLAESYFKQLLKIHLQIFGENHQEYASSLNNLGMLYHQMGNFVEADLNFKKALEIYFQVFGEDNLDYAAILSNLGVVCKNTDDYKGAELYYKKALDIYSRIIDEYDPEVAGTLLNLGNLCVIMGNYDAAGVYLKKSVEIYLGVYGDDDPKYARSLMNLGSLLLEKGDFEAAEVNYKLASDIVEKSYGDENNDYAMILDNLGILYRKMGDYISAESCCKKALQIYSRLFGVAHSAYANGLNNLGNLYLQKGEYKSAELYFKKAVDIFENIYGKEHTDYAMSINNLGSLYLKAGDYSNAEKSFKEALDIYNLVFGKSHLKYALSLDNLGNLYLYQGNYKAAEPYYKETLEIYRQILGEEHPDFISNETDYAYLLFMTARDKQACAILSENFNKKQRIILANFEWLSDNQREAYWKDESEFFDGISWFANISCSKVPELIALNYNSSLLSKGKMLENKITSENFYREVDEMREELAYRRRLLAKMESDGSTESIRMNKLRKEADSLDKKLTLSWPEYAQQKKNLTITWQQVQQNLDKGEAAIEFVRFYNEDDSLYYYNALVVKKGDSNPTLVRLCKEKELETITPKNGCFEYFPLIWQPLEGALEGITTVYYSPVGLLNNISFSAISISDSTEGENRYLLDRYNLHQLISTRYLAMGLKQKQFVKTEVSIALFGGLDYDFLPGIKNKKSGLGCRQKNMRGGEVSSYKVPFLQGTKDEVDQIASTFKSHVGNVQKFEGVNGTEEAFMQLENKASFTVLHVATHGFALPVFDFNDSTISKNSLRYSYRYSTNPMVRSGLIMSGGYWAWNGSDTLIKLGASQNGILTALEISQLNLRKTKLVVLSACETGLGKIDNSEGTFGLKRSFKLAGVEQLIVSLWSVPDKETKELMKFFYSDFAISLNPAESFNKAQKQMRNKYPDEPEKWAAFVLIR